MILTEKITFFACGTGEINMHYEIVDKIVKTILDKLIAYEPGELYNFLLNYEQSNEERKADIRKRVSS